MNVRNRLELNILSGSVCHRDGAASETPLNLQAVEAARLVASFIAFNAS